jgi:hypothetical protein
VLFLIERLALPGQRSAKRRAQFAPVEVLVDLDQLDRACGLRRFAGDDAAMITSRPLRLCASSLLRPATKM